VVQKGLCVLREMNPESSLWSAWNFLFRSCWS